MGEKQFDGCNASVKRCFEQGLAAPALGQVFERRRYMGNSYTISNSVGNHAEEHSRRTYIPFSAEASLGYRNIAIYDCGDDRAHLNSVAKPYIQEYNARQKRADRKKKYEDDYVAALESGEACYGVGDKKEKPFHHDVLQIGNRDNLGVTDADFNVDYWRRLKKQGKYDKAAAYVEKHLNKDENVDIAINILKVVAEEIKDDFSKKYTNILLHGLVIHADEPNGTPHLDMRYSIFTENEKTGVSWRVSDKKGLAAMGFETDATMTALQKFRESINKLVEEKMLEHGFIREYKNEHRNHLSTAQFEAEQRLKEAEKAASDIVSSAEAEAKELRSDYESEIAKYKVAKKEYQARKLELIDKLQTAGGIDEEIRKFLMSDAGRAAYMNYVKELDDEIEADDERTDVEFAENYSEEEMKIREELGIPGDLDPIQAVKYAQDHFNDDLLNKDRKKKHSGKKDAPIEVKVDSRAKEYTKKAHKQNDDYLQTLDEKVRTNKEYRRFYQYGK